MRRDELEERERKWLAPYAVKSGESMGRKFEEKSDDERLCFQRDKDRIVHSKAFRRLEEKTQVFTAGSGDHYRTRLTHTLEVTQISRGLARRLKLNEDLCEAIALAHDLGHPPFGHGGEDALDRVLQKHGLHFEHNEQSRRVVEVLEKNYPEFDGLNLSIEVLDGLIKHQTSFDQSGKKFKTSAHLEAQVVNVADEIAYTNHDMDDGLRSGFIKLSDLKKFEIWKIASEKVVSKYGEIINEHVKISRTISSIISMMIEDFCTQTEENIEKFGIKTLEDVVQHKGLIAHFSPAMDKMIAALRKHLYDNFYMNPALYKLVREGEKMIEKLFNYYIDNPDKFPTAVAERAGEQGDDYFISVKDYIAGMTDGYLVAEFKKI
ncbi:MAG: deoxyguanosinetriphosphate triphosphohydrolase [Nitrospirae bacterium]|nr:deoxyguanosinetriphosphate triphosphohydrolase [Nitrospirota bacterium]